MKIKEITYQSNRGLFELKLSKERLWASIELYHLFSLSKEKDLTEEELEKLRSFTRYTEGKKKAFDLLNYRERTQKEIKERLRREGLFDEEIEEIVHWLNAQGFLNDTRFAIQFINSKIRTKAHSRRRIEYDLIQKGLSREIIEEAFQNSEYSLEKEECLMIREAEKKAVTLRGNSFEKRNKLYRFLAQRGYDPSLIATVIEKVLHE